jgi:hypothetical protein
MTDIFDRITKKDIFDRLQERDNSEKELDSVIKTLSDSIKKTIKSNQYVPPPDKNMDEEVSKRLPNMDHEVFRRLPNFEKLKNDIIKSIPQPYIPDIPYLVREEIKKHPQKPVERVITKETVHEVKVEQSPLKIDPQEVRKAVEKDFKALKDDLDKIKETLPMIGGSGVKGLPNLESYSISNFTPTRQLDASSYSMDELANFIGTLIQDLKR